MRNCVCEKNSEETSVFATLSLAGDMLMPKYLMNCNMLTTHFF
ncbi:Uncharacterized protein dnm_010080 [Desulfonema magnum]|uniref:Uncharacterized protein n=1 Tax=Desulfonema magnum TaxID=45655 RepID=A0A975GKU2_9BACT|nr:Uncharacterized protein dnm_010080 [Desulfonema magnum]